MKKTKTILIVDDEPDILRCLEFEVKAAGYDALVASDGEDALEKTKSENPDLIILDVMLPKIDGYEVCRRIKYDATTYKTPIIILTCKHAEVDRIEGLTSGADAFFTKMFDTEFLFAKIKELLAG